MSDLPVSSIPIEIRQRNTSGRSAMSLFFALWGVCGLAASLLAGASAPILSAIYVTLMWMAGVLFFGIGALLSHATLRTLSAFPVYVVQPPRADGMDNQYRGVPYRVNDDGTVYAEFADGSRTFRNWKKFVTALPTDRSGNVSS